MADMINACLRDEMRRDPRIVVYGEDVADATRGCAEGSQGQGRSFSTDGGVADGVRFGAGLQLAAGGGEHRRPRGWAMRCAGMKPVVEIQFFDYIWPACTRFAMSWR
jgi:2-oxoisovalerate dehydrogenase E1 component